MFSQPFKEHKQSMGCYLLTLGTPRARREDYLIKVREDPLLKLGPMCTTKAWLSFVVQRGRMKGCDVRGGGGACIFTMQTDRCGSQAHCQADLDQAAAAD
jgi:hypothetical protein